MKVVLNLLCVVGLFCSVTIFAAEKEQASSIGEKADTECAAINGDVSTTKSDETTEEKPAGKKGHDL